MIYCTTDNRHIPVLYRVDYNECLCREIRIFFSHTNVSWHVKEWGRAGRREGEGANRRGGKERGKMLSGRVMGFVRIFWIHSWQWDDGHHRHLVDFSGICFQFFSSFQPMPFFLSFSLRMKFFFLGFPYYLLFEE